jgi:uncharacterized protein YbjT (DUF2867 family)
MRLALFGATGRIGSRLLNWAVDAGHPVHVVARDGAAGPGPGSQAAGFRTGRR